MRSKRHLLRWVLALLFAIVYFLFLNDVVRSLMWHLAHGDKVAYQGHTMRLPLLWRQEDSSGAKLELSRAAFFHPFVDAGLSGPEFLAIGQGGDPSATFDDAAAARWQTSMVASFKAANLFAKPENLTSGAMTFYCFNRDDANTHGGALDCKAGGTNWEVIFRVGDGGAGVVEGQLDEAREILKSVQ